jgi:branched-subunit amino acid aminotransferase/4-amino-4-deoxychorismate lyase
LDEQSLTSGLKTTGFLERIQALRLARDGGADEALLRNSRGLIVEGSASNLFAVRGTTLVSPGPAVGALPGITRDVILEVATQAGVTVEERGIDRSELPELSELFLTSSLREVVSIVGVEGNAIGTGRPGEVATKLAKLFREVVKSELKR